MKRRLAFGAVLVALVSLATIGVTVVLDRSNSRHDPSAQSYEISRATRDVVAHWAHIKLPPDSDLGREIDTLPAATLDRCLDLDPHGAPQHAVTIPTTNAFAQVAAIAQWLQHDRGLQFTRVPVPQFVTQPEMRTILNVRTDPSQARDQSRFLAALGEVPDGTSLVNADDELSSALAGVWRPREQQLLVVGDETKPLSRWTMVVLAHEMEHALVDQALHAFSAHSSSTDNVNAGRALFEGDATLTMIRFNLAAFGTDRAATTSPKVEYHVADVPTVVGRLTVVKYSMGFVFACRMKNDGSYSALDTHRDFTRRLPRRRRRVLPNARGPQNASTASAPSSSIRTSRSGTSGIRSARSTT